MLVKLTISSSAVMFIFYVVALLTFSATHLQGTPVQNVSTAFIEKQGLIDLTRFGERIYGHPDKAAGEKLSNLEAYEMLNPEELGPYLEGDLLIPHGQKLIYRNGLTAYSARWPRGIVPYEIKGRFSQQELAVIDNAFQEYHNKTCIRFKPRSNERDYVVITGDSTGCWGSVGRLGGKQVVNLQPVSCFRKPGTPLHELMHALGFVHEHNRHERDSYIRVLRQNVKNGMLFNFDKASPSELYSYGVPYDYASVMHYSKRSFSKNGQPTIEVLKQTSDSSLMGQRIGFSKGDIAKLNAMYKCKTQ
ncbi:zinc metalloproteinase nas-1 [Bactrocera neohumeralis]|uniref:zinc metalloproteinase nas-1 n=1 Tax=Bactrocera neohumeralis TaxID=98809 RepID=UPI00216556D1|nr:zinc metalloproteinase nas-1 [Bactrocera neohumeralis]